MDNNFRSFMDYFIFISWLEVYKIYCMGRPISFKLSTCCRWNCNWS